MNLTKEQHENLITDVDKFNKFLDDFTEHIMQRVMLEIPALVSYHVREVSRIKTLREKFYQANPELKGKESLIIQAVNGISSKHPEMSREEVYREAGKEAKRLLKMETNYG